MFSLSPHQNIQVSHQTCQFVAAFVELAQIYLKTKINMTQWNTHPHRKFPSIETGGKSWNGVETMWKIVYVTEIFFTSVILIVHNKWLLKKKCDILLSGESSYILQSIF